MTDVTRSRVAWAIAITSFVIIVTGVAISVALDWSNDTVLNVTVILSVAAWGSIGALIASRTSNRIGWVLLGVVGLTALTFVAQAYATVSLVNLDGRLPADEVIGVLNQVSFTVMLALIVAIPLLYPTGEPRWRWVWRAYLACLGVIGVGWLLLPQKISLGIDSDRFAAPESPLGVQSLAPVLGLSLAVASIGVVVIAALAVLSLVLRYREAEGDARQQIRWLAYVGVSAITLLILTFASFGLFGDPPGSALESFISNALFALMLWTIVFGIPIACGVAILRYHLYDLDLVIKKALVALLLALSIALIAAVALALTAQVALWQGTPRGIALAIGLVLGALLLPLLRGARRVADRIVYGKRATPYEVLASFSSRVGETYSTDDVLVRMADILRAGAGASSVRVLVQVGRAMQEAAASGDPMGDDHTVPITYQGDEVGALVVTFPANDPMDRDRERLIEQLAAQAGPVVRNVRLIEELRASRQRLVAAQDQERRRLERNIHDGVQQQLVALAVKLKLADTLVERDPAKAHDALAALQKDATTALEDLRDLARGIYPPLLADQGLAAALEAQARKAAVPVRVDSDGVGRYDQAVEAAVYFCTLEALNNVAKYANASQASVSLAQTDGHLSFTIHDDGRGFDPATATYGTGLQGMADRLDAIGGTLRVTSEPATGTTIVGRVPV
jgi:signal transduction histidine kinase